MDANSLAFYIMLVMLAIAMVLLLIAALLDICGHKKAASACGWPGIALLVGSIVSACSIGLDWSALSQSRVSELGIIAAAIFTLSVWSLRRYNLSSWMNLLVIFVAAIALIHAVVFSGLNVAMAQHWIK